MRRASTAANCVSAPGPRVCRRTAKHLAERPGALRSVGGTDHVLRIGALVRTSANLFPHYEVIAISGDKAWVRDVQYGTDVVVPAERCMPIERQPRHQTHRAN